MINLSRTLGVMYFWIKELLYIITGFIKKSTALFGRLKADAHRLSATHFKQLKIPYHLLLDPNWSIESNNYGCSYI